MYAHISPYLVVSFTFANEINRLFVGIYQFSIWCNCNLINMVDNIMAMAEPKWFKYGLFSFCKFAFMCNVHSTWIWYDLIDVNFVWCGVWYVVHQFHHQTNVAYPQSESYYSLSSQVLNVVQRLAVEIRVCESRMKRNQTSYTT